MNKEKKDKQGFFFSLYGEREKKRKGENKRERERERDWEGDWRVDKHLQMTLKINLQKNLELHKEIYTHTHTHTILHIKDKEVTLNNHYAYKKLLLESVKLKMYVLFKCKKQTKIFLSLFFLCKF